MPQPHLTIRILATAALLLAAPFAAVAQEKSINPGINKSYEKPNVEKYVDRFEREGRDVFDHRTEILAAIDLKPGMAVADIGAGTGLFTRMFSAAVGKDGKVYAVDISEEFVGHITKDAQQRGRRNIVGVVCKADSVELPPASIDLAFICDTYHHFEYPHRTMKSIHQALKPGGEVVVIDFHRIEGKSPKWIMGHVRAGQEVFTKEIAAAGFKLVDEKKDLLDENYFLRFERIDSPLPSSDKNE